MTPRIGVFICECGPNIKEAIDIEQLVSFSQQLPQVVFVRPFNLFCSPQGKALLTKDIQEQSLNRIVIAACSPKEHEATFKKVVTDAGLNAYLLQLANIREQCAWVVKDKVLATAKAKLLINAAVKRVALHELLESQEIECQNDVLVVGAGVAGISAALALAQKMRKVYLVEKSPVIGGKVSKFEKIFPSLECASCMLEPKLDEVLHHEQIELLTQTSVQQVAGYYGNFIVKLKKLASCVDEKSCIGCGACSEVCPVKVKNEYNEGLDERKAIYIPYPGALPHLAVIDKIHCLRFKGQECDLCQKACAFGSIDYKQADEEKEIKAGAIVLATGFDCFDPAQAPEYGYGKIENIYTALEFERMLDISGPTAGKILLKNGKAPKKIALVHCVGSRTKKFYEHCSEICCLYLLKFAKLIKEKIPQAALFELYSDFCLPGKSGQPFFNQVTSKTKISFLHLNSSQSLKIKKHKSGILINYTDVNKKNKNLLVDLVVLAGAVKGSKDVALTAEIFDVTKDKSGFFIEEQQQLAPVSSSTQGIFIVGCAKGAKNIPASVTEAEAAAGLILSKLYPGEKLVPEVMVALINDQLCSGCKVCIGLCPYKAITYDTSKKQAVVNEVLCRGCGICVASCPSAAIKAKHFTDQQIEAEIQAQLE